MHQVEGECQVEVVFQGAKLLLKILHIVSLVFRNNPFMWLFMNFIIKFLEEKNGLETNICFAAV